MIYVGLDMSITSPGLCIIDGLNVEYHFRYDLPKRKVLDFPFNFYPNPTCEKNQDDILRYIDNAEWIMSCLAGRPGRIAIEGYSYGSSAGQAFNIAENCMTTKLHLHQAGYEILTPSPKQIKKWASGNGNAGKGLMVHSFCEKTNIDLYDIFKRDTPSSPLSDIADSYFMATWARDCWE